MNETVRPPNENLILSALPREDYHRLSSALESVDMPRGQILYPAEGHIDYVYFPSNSMVSLVSQLSDGTAIEVGVTGFEGMVGLPVVLGVNDSPHECMVQIPNGAVRVRAEVIKQEFGRGGALHDLLLRYTQSLMLTLSLVATCNRAHSVGERLARWLLMCYDRCVMEELPLTQEFLAMMLGTRRAGVTEAAVLLQAEGSIVYRRGRITIADLDGLRASACECYSIVKAEFDRLPGR